MCDACFGHQAPSSWYDDWTPAGILMRLDGFLNTTPGRVIITDGGVLAWVLTTWAADVWVPYGPEIAGAGTLPASITLSLLGLLLLGALVVLAGRFIVAAPVWLFMLHVEAWRNYVPTPRNRARWVLDALRDAGKEKQ